MLFGEVDGEHACRKRALLLKGAVAFIQNSCIHPAVRANDMFCVPFCLFCSFFGLTSEIHHTVVSTAELDFMQHSAFLLSAYLAPFARKFLAKCARKELTNKKGKTIPAHSHLWSILFFMESVSFFVLLLYCKENKISMCILHKFTQF